MRGKELLFGGAGVQGHLANGGLALLRVFAGLAMALQHGIGKIPPSDGFIAGVQKLGFPLAEGFAWAAGTSEFLGGLLLALGLLTRPAAACVAGTMAVAAFGRHAADPFQNKELALLYLGVALLFVALGAGRYGVDAFLRRDERV